MTIAQLIMSLLVALGCATVPELARTLPGRFLVGVLGVAIVLSALGMALSASPYPWTNIPVVLMALSGGLLLGRRVPPRSRPFFVVLAVLSAVDALQIVLTGGLVAAPSASVPLPSAGTAPGALAYLNLIVLLPAGRFLMGALDVLLLAAMAEHWRRRGAPYLIRSLPGILGLLLAAGAVLLTQLTDWPLIPFFTVGWLLSERARRWFG